MNELALAEALQHHGAREAERELTSRFDEFAHDARDQDLAAACGIGDARRDHDMPTEEIAVVSEDDLSGVRPDAHTHTVSRTRSRERVQRSLHVDHAQERTSRAREAEHEPIALGLDLGSAVSGHAAAHD